MHRLKIKEVREEKNLTQREVSELTGISRNYISELENMKHDPTMEVMMMISLGLHVELAKLIAPEDIEIQQNIDREILKQNIISLILENDNLSDEFIRELFDEIILNLSNK